MEEKDFETVYGLNELISSAVIGFFIRTFKAGPLQVSGKDRMLSDDANAALDIFKDFFMEKPTFIRALSIMDAMIEKEIAIIKSGAIPNSMEKIAKEVIDASLSFCNEQPREWNIIRFPPRG
jgi:hypothetical protein